MAEKTIGPMGVEELGKSVSELVSLGCSFTVDGTAFEATIHLLEKLIIDGNADKQGESFLINLRAMLLQTSVPVKSKLKQTIVCKDDDESKIIIPH
jgi:hypothetical protein